MMGWLTDLKHAARSLRAQAGTAVLATFTLAIGLAAATAIYAVIDAVLLRDLPYPHAERLVQIRERDEDGHDMALAYPNYADLASTVDAFDATAYYTDMGAPVTYAGNTQRHRYALVGDNFFQVLGVAPVLGRSFSGDERARLAVIGFDLWQSRFGGRADVLGQVFEINGETHSVIGVMPRGFAFPAQAALWTPVLSVLDHPGNSRSAHNFDGIGRLHAGEGLAQARLAASALAKRLHEQHGDDVDAAGFDLMPLRDAIAAPVRNALLLLAAGTAFLLLIAMTNATNLLLAVNVARGRELAVRSALGASRARLARQVFAESLLIAGSACVLGLTGASLAIRLLLRSGGAGLPRLDDIALDPAAIGMGILLALAMAGVVALAVLLGSQRGTPNASLRESGRGLSAGKAQLRMRATLLVGQTALTTLLLFGAGLLTRNFVSLMSVDPGFDGSSAMRVELIRPWSQDAAVAAETARRYQALIDAFASLPGVDAAGGVNALPLTGSGAGGTFWDGSVTDLASLDAVDGLGYAEFRIATADYFRAAGMRMLSGRGFDARDRADGENVAVISAAAARTAWGNADPIGKRIQFGNMDGDARILTVIGVVNDVHEHRLDRAPSGTIYLNLGQRPMAASEFNIVVRSALPLAALEREMRGQLQSLAGDIPHRLAPLAEVRTAALAERRLSLVLLGIFAGVALLLAVGGLYGLMAFAVTQRGHEFALRQVLGATPARILGLVLHGGMAIAAIGVASGLALAWASARALSGMLYGVPAGDLLVSIGVVVLLLATTLLACLLPARRACTVAPREALS